MAVNVMSPLAGELAVAVRTKLVVVLRFTSPAIVVASVDVLTAALPDQ